MKIWLNVTTDDGELLGRIEIPVTEDKLYPIGTSMARAAILSEIEGWARCVQAREGVEA